MKNSEEPSTHRILAFDFGSKRIGLAIWEPKTKWVSPLPARIRKTLKDDIRFFTQLVHEKEVQAFLVGLPIGLDGKYTKSTENAIFWVDQLKKNFDLPVHTYDESLSTRDALNLLKDRSKSEQMAKKDSVSAALILEDFLRDQPIAVLPPKDLS